jgi:hypothetical protein
VIVSRVGHGRSGATGAIDPIGLLMPALARNGWVDSAAVRLRDGRTFRRVGDAAAPWVRNLAPGAEVMVIVLRDLVVFPAVAGEHGCHVVQSLTGEPDLIRIEVRPGGADADRVLADHLAARDDFDAAARAGKPLPANPDRLLPVVRALSYRSPLRPGESFRVELEDFTTGWVATVDMASIAAVVMRAMELRWSSS